MEKNFVDLMQARKLKVGKDIPNRRCNNGYAKTGSSSLGYQTDKKP
jgi:hypothetical protein